MLNIQPDQKNRLFFEKVGFFLPPGGPNVRNFCLETLMSVLLKNNKSCRFRQQMLFSASNQSLRDFWPNLSRKIGVLRVVPPFAFKSDTGNKTQKCSETRFQGRRTVLERLTSPKSDNGAHFTHFRGKVSFSKSVTFWRWERLSKGTGNSPENTLESWIFFQQHFIPNVAEKNFCCRLRPP